jgi:hypothetical protein
VPRTIDQVPGTIGQVPACSTETLSVQPSAYVFDRVPACSTESLHVRSSPWVFSHVLGWCADSFLGGNSGQCEAVSVFNPQDSKLPLPPGRLQRSG